jgi:hypothetical protein
MCVTSSRCSQLDVHDVNSWFPVEEIVSRCKGEASRAPNRLDTKPKRSRRNAPCECRWWSTLVGPGHRAPLWTVLFLRFCPLESCVCSVLEKRDYGRGDQPRWPHDTNPQKVALTSPTSGGRLVGIVRPRTEATDFYIYMYLYVYVCVFVHDTGHDPIMYFQICTLIYENILDRKGSDIRG